jgi:hypothetical protein
MVYYISYPYRSESLEPWWIVQRVCPPGRLPIPGDEGYDEYILVFEQQEEEGRGPDEEEYVANVDGDGDGGSGEGDGCEDREECEDGDGDAEEEEEEDTAAQPVFRYL